MRSIIVRCLAAASIAGLVTPPVFASNLPSMPPLKTGLWETTMERMDAKGNHVETGSERMQKTMQNMPPEARAQMLAMMKARGMDPGNGAIRTCMTKEQFTPAYFDAMMAGTSCKVSFTTRTLAHWKWHTSCATLNIESDGDTTFSSPEGYSTKAVSTSGVMGKQIVSSMTVTSKWLGSSCGDIKPIEATP